MHSRLAIALSFALTLVTATAYAGPAHQIRPDRRDVDLADRVSHVVQHYSRFTVFDDVTITVLNRNVTLEGWVTEPFKRDEVGKQVARIDGIRAFRNAIVVLPVSMTDNDLRQRIARAIYGNSMFWRYASMTNPPIHIIVDSGQVTLTGCVDGENEKGFAFALAHVRGAMSVKNSLTIEK